MSGRHDGSPLDPFEAMALRAAFNVEGEVAQMKADLREALRESFAIHAPACPEWWAPDYPPGVVGAVARYEYRIARWPWAYADRVLDARGGE